MKKTRKLLSDLITFNASEEIYIVLSIAKLGAFLAGVAVGYYLL